jgi:microcystin-dependent protein
LNDITLNPKYTYGEAIAANDVLYLKAVDGKVWKADYDVSATLGALVGVAIEAGDADTTHHIIPPGKIATGASLTAGSPVYLSSTAGGATATVTAVQIGLAITTTLYLFYPETRRIPSGMIMAYGAAAAPDGWLLCDGASLLRASYPELFAVIGTTYGSADGTHFNAPNMKGKVVVGYNSAETEFDALGETGGEKTHQLTVAELAAHTHSLPNTSGGGGSLANGIHSPTVAVPLPLGCERRNAMALVGCILCKRVLNLEYHRDGKPLKDGEYVICEACGQVLSRWLKDETSRRDKSAEPEATAARR